MKKKFSPLLFLASLGAGGISIMPFAIMQYSVPHGPGLISLGDLMSMGLSTVQWIFYIASFAVMAIFGVIHIVLTVAFLARLFPWLKTEEAKNLIKDPLKNAGILTPLLSIAMTMNVMIGTVRFFVPRFAENLQTVMLPALVFWLVLWAFTMGVEIKLLKSSFVEGYDVEKINFGWLLHPFTIGMVSVVGAGIAALAKNADIANIAAFFTIISASMGFFLFVVKLVTLFKRHFASKEGLGEKQFMPSFLIVLPNITLYSITFFRLVHYLGVQLESHIEWLSFAIIVGGFAFSTRYLFFGLSLMKDYFKEHFFKKEFYVTQWGLICPFVAYAVLGAFAYSQFFQSKIIYALIMISAVVAIVAYFLLLSRQMKCCKGSKEMSCS